MELTDSTTAGRIQIGYRSPGLSGSCDASQKMALAGSLGMQVIEPQLVEREFPDEASVEDYRRAADSAGISIPTVGAMMGLTVPGGWSQIRLRVEQVIAQARVLGAGYVFTCAQWPPAGVGQPAAWSALVEHIQRVADRMAEAGLQLAIEPEWFIGSVERMRRLVSQVSHANLWVNFDPTNFYINGSDPAEALSVFGRRMVNGHIKDAVFRSDRRSEVPVGEGEVDYPALFGQLLSRGLQMTLHIEHCKRAEQVRSAASRVRHWLQQLQA